MPGINAVGYANAANDNVTDQLSKKELKKLLKAQKKAEKDSLTLGQAQFDKDARRALKKAAKTSLKLQLAPVSASPVSEELKLTNRQETPTDTVSLSSATANKTDELVAVQEASKETANPIRRPSQTLDAPIAISSLPGQASSQAATAGGARDAVGEHTTSTVPLNIRSSSQADGTAQTTAGPSTTPRLVRCRCRLSRF
jgi:hypothetical protein